MKQNKDDTSRPHYFAFIDRETQLYWLIPCSSRIEKFERIIENKIERGRPHNHIQIISVSGKKQAFLFQDMFPVTPRYIDKPYENRYGIFEIRDPKMIEQINRNAEKIINLLRRGIKFTPTQPDVNKIEKLMLAELHEKTAEMISERSSAAQPEASQQAEEDEYDMEI